MSSDSAKEDPCGENQEVVVGEVGGHGSYYSTVVISSERVY